MRYVGILAVYRVAVELIACRSVSQLPHFDPLYNTKEGGAVPTQQGGGCPVMRRLPVEY